jgi:hypothetical protein
LRGVVRFVDRRADSAESHRDANNIFAREKREKTCSRGGNNVAAVGGLSGLIWTKKTNFGGFCHLIVFGGVRWGENRAGTGGANKK